MWNGVTFFMKYPVIKFEVNLYITNIFRNLINYYFELSLILNNKKW